MEYEAQVCVWHGEARGDFAIEAGSLKNQSAEPEGPKYRPAPLRSRRAKQFRGLGDVLGLHPENRAEAPFARSDRIERRNGDLGFCELGQDVRERADFVVALQQFAI